MSEHQEISSRVGDQGCLFVVSAPSGAGKTSLVRALIDTLPELGVAVSHTTRPQRPDETDGINYHFISIEAFRSQVARGDFLEHATVFDHLYGTSVSAANKVLEAGKHLVLEIDWQGAQQVRSRFPAARSVFIFPPSLKALRERLEGRAQDDPETVERRMNAAFEELSHWEEFDYLVVNDDFDMALNEMRQIVTGKGENFRKSARLEALNPLIRDLLPHKLP
jgi:guanylate kinase